MYCQIIYLSIQTITRMQVQTISFIGIFSKKKIEIRLEKYTRENTQEWMFLVNINMQSVSLFRLKNVYCIDFIESY